MTDNANNARPLKLRFTEEVTGRDLPGALRATTRAGPGDIDPLLDGVQVERAWLLPAGARAGEVGTPLTLRPEAAQLLALEADDGTLFIRSDTLAQEIERVRPEAVADGEVELALFRDPNAAARGFGDVLWRAVSVLRLPADGLAAQAADLALAWARERLGERIEQRLYERGSVLGAKALMWVIESRLAGRSGLYRWQDRLLAPTDRCGAGDPRLQAAARGAPMLVLIHGTASYTVGSFTDLREDEDAWAELLQRFPGGIYGYEHRTFSQSPIENAIELAEALPPGARVSLLTHSRGGLVGDLLCLGQVDERVIDAYSIDARGIDDAEGLAREAQEERGRLRALRGRLAGITVERYVRVACPARGTRILSENLDAALSDLLGVAQAGGGALLGVAAWALGGPVAGEVVGTGASSALGVLKRLLLEIADKRIDARLVPGIAAMRVDSPLAAFLAHPLTRRRDEVRMAVIAGDTEFDGAGVSNLGRRIANLFCDWRLFDRQDNDLVVDTDSMYAGLGFREGASYLYDQDASVTHFRYFRNPLTRNALRGWLTAEDPARLGQFLALTAQPRIAWRELDARAARRGAAEEAQRPVVILLPGIMGTHLEVDRRQADRPGSGNRIWFDLFSLNWGRLGRIADPAQPGVFVEDIWERFYGELAEYLAQTHAVLRCPYDWRQSPEQGADALRARIEQAARKHPGRPIRLLAHSMGGLVARVLMRSHPDAWRTVVASGGRLVMLGTPNRGSHLMVHSLLGKTDVTRMLERVDSTRDLQQIVDVVTGFPGALALLPHPGLEDAGIEPRIASAEYYRDSVWQGLKAANTDRWYGDGIGALPSAAMLERAEGFWTDTLADATVSDAHRVAHVFGQSARTPCGVQRTPQGRLRLLYTSEGDGSVTWVSGRLDNLPEERCWVMPVEHADLTGEAEYFPAILDLLQTGATERLGRLPRQRGAPSPGFVLDAGPPVVPSEEELGRAAMGSGPGRRRSSRARRTLRVSVHAGDLRFVDQPVMCGHYIGDAISGGEASLDEMLDRRLSERQRLGVYAGAIGTSAIVLQAPKGEERARGSLPGAVVVGLGDYNGQLASRQITETVRAGVLRYLLQLQDIPDLRRDRRAQLYSLLIGFNSNVQISIRESLRAVTRGVLDANRHFAETLGRSAADTVAVTDLCFVEMFLDAAITAARTVLELPAELEPDLKRLEARLEPARTMTTGLGARERLSADVDLGHWSRLIVTDADAPAAACPPECYEARLTSPIPPELLERLRPGGAGVPPADASPARERYYPQRLKYVFLSARARAETVSQQRQPGLVEAIIRDQRRNPAYDARLGSTLFQLLVPLDFRAAAREQARLLLVLDRYTANLPWELLCVDGEPLVLKARFVRQLATARYRLSVRSANVNAACIIAAPSTEGYDLRFGGNERSLPDLPGAAREGQAVRDSLRAAGWNEQDIVVAPEGRAALDVLATLYERPYRILMIAAHGVFEARGADGNAYTGVVLSEGLLLTAVEIGQMEVVPEVVFLNCCHLGSVSNAYSEPNRLAYSLAGELIEMGVRCVVAAGWAVNDDAATTFAAVFFDRLTRGVNFGEALYAARWAAYLRHPGSNTWGAYQAYGEPGYRLVSEAAAGDAGRMDTYVAAEELLAALTRRCVDSRRMRKSQAVGLAEQRRWVERELARCPADWAERPVVLQAVAELYAECGEEGYEAACEAYAAAVQREDGSGRVSIRSIEQLAELEARRGEALARRGGIEEGLRLIGCAIDRLASLKQPAACPESMEGNPERAALLGSALKHQASVMVYQGKSWDDVSPVLLRAAQAYGEDGRVDFVLHPYNALNALALEAVAQPAPRAGALELVLRLREDARRRFAMSKGFWEAVMSADAYLTAWLLGYRLEEPAEATLRAAYDEAVGIVPLSALEWESVVGHWRLLAGLLRLRAREGDRERAHVLSQLADCYAPQPAPDTARREEAPSPAPPPRPRQRRRKKT